MLGFHVGLVFKKKSLVGFSPKNRREAPCFFSDKNICTSGRNDVVRRMLPALTSRWIFLDCCARLSLKWGPQAHLLAKLGSWLQLQLRVCNLLYKGGISSANSKVQAFHHAGTASPLAPAMVISRGSNPREQGCSLSLN